MIIRTSRMSRERRPISTLVSKSRQPSPPSKLPPLSGSLLPQPYRADRIRYASRYPLIVETILRLKVRTIVIDGEAMCFRGAAHDFDKLWNRTHDHEAKLCAFDLLELDGEDYRAKPLRERKQSLFKLLRPAYGGIEYVEHLEGDGPMIFEHACKLGLEGIVSKRIDLHYRAGLSQS
jgi:bifunctional non-homologous end joining protein LigD